MVFRNMSTHETETGAVIPGPLFHATNGALRAIAEAAHKKGTGTDVYIFVAWLSLML